MFKMRQRPSSAVQLRRGTNKSLNPRPNFLPSVQTTFSDGLSLLASTLVFEELPLSALSFLSGLRCRESAIRSSASPLREQPLATFEMYRLEKAVRDSCNASSSSSSVRGCSKSSDATERTTLVSLNVDLVGDSGGVL